MSMEKDGLAEDSKTLLQAPDQKLSWRLHQKDEQIAWLMQSLAEKEEAIRILKGSRSWRWTRPLRMANVIKKRLSRLVARIRQEGWTQTLYKTLTVLRKEGWRSLRLRLAAMSNPAADYTEWVRRYDTLDAMQRARISERIAGLANPPLISVLMPCFNPNPEWFREAIESVRSQLYPHWELCIADDASTDPAIRPILEDYIQRDARIRVAFRTENGHISASSNSALELVTGKFVALLDHDDLLPEHALFWVADAIAWHPEAGVIYSDEDKIDEFGTRFEPYFKCDWNPDLFLSQNMISHLGVYRTELMRAIGGFRQGFEGSQDHDLALRCIEKLTPEQIIHIPRVLYHWRVHASSTAQSPDAKPYAILAGQKAIEEHLARKGVNARVEIGSQPGYRVHYALPDAPPMVSIIIPTRNGLELLRQCVDSILSKTDYVNFEILIIDNGSDDQATLEYLQNLSANPKIRVLRDERPFNYSALNNSAVEQAKGELICLLNNDIEVISREWLGEMASIALQPSVGAVGACLWYPDNTLQHGGVILGIGGVAGHSHKFLIRGQFGYFGRAIMIQSLSAVTAACLVIRKSTYQSLGGLDEKNLQIAFNDVDFCLRLLEAGYRNVWTPFAELYHHESASRGTEDTEEKKNRFANEVNFMKKHHAKFLHNDPAYSPNLTLEIDDFSYAWPPRAHPI